MYKYLNIPIYMNGIYISIITYIPHIYGISIWYTTVYMYMVYGIGYILYDGYGILYIISYHKYDIIS